MYNTKINKFIFFLIFLGLIYAPFIGQIFNVGTYNLDDFRKRENRNPYEYPKFPLSFTELEQFPSSFENAFNDQFAFRKFLIEFFGVFSINLMKVSPHHQLLVGKNGHCFLASHGNGVNDLIFNTLTIDEQTIRRESDDLRKYESFLEDLKVPTLMLAIPTSPLFDFRNLPSFIQKQIDPSFLETPPTMRIIQSMPKEFTEKYLLYPYKKALEANKVYPLFPEKNFHWLTSRYTKLVASCIADRFKIAAYEKPGMDEFRKEQTISDLSRFTGTNIFNRNDLVYKGNILSSLHIQDKNPSDVYENYPAFPYGLYTVNPTKKGKLLLVGDSFSPALRFDLARYFGEVHTIDFNVARTSTVIRKWFQCMFEDIQPNYIVFCRHNNFKIFEEFIDKFYSINNDLAKLPNKTNEADAKSRADH